MDDKNIDNPRESNVNSINGGDKKPDINEDNTIPTEEKQYAAQNSNKGKGINKYIVIAVIVIIILLIIAYIMYHFNILGVRAFVRNTLGLNHKTSTTSINSSSSNTSSNLSISSANAALISKVSSYFPSLHELNLTAAVINANNLNSNGFLHYSAFGEGNIITPFENGTYPINYSGILMLFSEYKTNETLNDFYESVPTGSKEYNFSFDGIPAVLAIDNITPPSNSSSAYSEGALNVSSYSCGLSGFKITLYNNRNQTVSVTGAEVFNDSNAYGNGSVFSSSGPAKPGKTLMLSFPKEICNSSSSYVVAVRGSTNYSISNMSTFFNFITFSNKLQVNIPNYEFATVGISNSTAYEISVLAGGNNYISQINSSFKKFVESLSASDFN